MIKNLIKIIGKFLLFNLKIIYSLIFSILIFLGLIFSFVKTTPSQVNNNYEYVFVETNALSDDKYNNTKFFDENSVNFKDFEDKLENIRKNSKVKGIILNLDNINLTSSQIEEISKILIKYPNSNKKIFAYGSNIHNSTYKLATFADEIIMPNTLNARLSINGYYHNSLYFKNLLDKFGITVEALHVGSHKSYGENYYLNTMSNELRENTTRLLDNRLNNYINTISNNRKINRNTLSENILAGKYDSISSYTAKDLGLIDTILDFDDFLDKNNINNNNIINIADVSTNNEKDIDKNKAQIAIIDLEGPISSGSNSINFSISELSVRDKLSKIENNKNIKAVILRINSGGGDALEAEKIYKLIKRYNKKTHIPIYASLSDIAASGGYYIATSANKIYANEATITGSIGVVSLIPKFDKTLSKFNINNSTIKKGEFSGIYNPYYTLSDKDKEHIIDNLNDVYIEFKHRVSQSRNISDSDLEPIAGGRVWLGNEAKNIRLVDDIASLNEVIDIVAKENNIKDFNVLQVTSNIDFNNFIDKFKSRFIKTKSLKIYDNIYKKLFFINENSIKPLYLNYGINEINY